MELRHQTVELTRGQPLTRQLDAVHPGLRSASAMISAPSSTDGPTEAFCRPKGLVAGDGVGGDAADLLIGRVLVEQFGQPGGITHLLVVNSAARISSVFSSVPIWIMRRTRRFGPPCLRVPLPFVLDLDAGGVYQQTQRAARSATGTVDLLGIWRRDSVLKAGTDHPLQGVSAKRDDLDPQPQVPVKS